MSAVKHQPITPLPFTRTGIFIDARTSQGYLRGEYDKESDTYHSIATCHGLRGADHAAYLTHTANAYPKLIERTQRRESWMRSVLAALPEDLRPMYEEAFGAEAASDAALLRDLGEES